jgi:hypothetical protein
MKSPARNIDVDPAVSDLEARTLARLPGEFSRLVYLASSRDCNTGHYLHEGLSYHFGEMAASEAMGICHERVFEELVYCPLEEMVQKLHDYIASTHERPENILKSWSHLQSYRITIPSDCDELAAEMFWSNVKVALKILEECQRTTPLKHFERLA